MTEDKALDKALEALEQYTNVVTSVNDPNSWETVVDGGKPARDAITAIKQARSAPVQEPKETDFSRALRLYDEAVDRLSPAAQPAPVTLTDEQKVLRSLLGAALGALRYHTEQTRPIQRTNETITAIEHELAAHGIK